MIAAKFTAWPPNGAEAIEKTPVLENSGPGSGRKPLALRTARPGMFCDAMVTMKSGNAMPIIAGTENSGATNNTTGHIDVSDSADRSVAQMTMVTRSAAGTANSRFSFHTNAQAAMIGRASAGSSATARTGARQKVNRTPASMALARGAGIASTQRPSGFHRPARTISTAVARKAPTAAAKPPAAVPVVARRAAPGVDQAMLTGIFVLRER